MADRKLRPLSKPEDLAQIPVNEPVLVELPAGMDQYDGAEQALESAPEQETQADPGVDQLREQLKQAEAAREEDRKRIQKATEDAARERQARLAAEEKAKRAEEQDRKNTKEFFGTAIDGAKAERDAAKIAFQSAFTNGDAAAMADAQDRIANANARLVQLESAKHDYDAAPEPQRIEPQPVQQDVMSKIESDPNLLPKEKDWIKLHPEAVLDAARNQELGVAYNRAMREGLQRGTDAYFEYIDKFMGYAKPAHQSREENTNVAAPVTREAPDGQNRPGQVRLSPEQRELARSMGLTDTQYALGVLKLQNEKKDNPERYARTA